MRKSVMLAMLLFAVAVVAFFIVTQYVSIKPPAQRLEDRRIPRVIIYKYSWGEIAEQDADLVAQELRRQLGDDLRIDLDVVVVEGTDYGTALDVGLAAGEQIDAFLVGGNQLGYWYRRGGVVTPLNELVDRWGPDLHRAIPARLWDEVTIDGQILSIPGYADARGPCIVVRKDILDRYHLPLPRTIEELTAVSRRLREFDPGIVPISGAWWDFGTLLCPALGIEHWDAHIVDQVRGMIYTGHKREDFYDFFVHLRGWYDEGLLDTEFLSANFDRIKELLFTGRNVFTFNNVERTNDWARELAGVNPRAELSVIPELNGAGVYSPQGEIPHHLIIPQSSVKKDEIVRFANWVFQSPEHYYLVHLGIEGRHYRRQAHSFVSIEPTRYRGLFTPVVNKDFALPNANMYQTWYSAIEEVQKVKWKTDILSGQLFLDASIERSYPQLVQFDREWWKYLDGSREPSAENYRTTLALYFDNGGTEISRSYYQSYVAQRRPGTH